MRPDTANRTKPSFIETAAGKIAVFENGAGVPIVLLHANAHDHSDYDLVVPALAEKFRVIAVDLPGHGASEWPHFPECISAVKIAEALEEIIGKMDLKRPILVGNSIGGFAAIQYALRHPAKTRGLVLVNPGGFNSADLKAKIFCNLMGFPAISGALWNLFPQSYLRVKNGHVRGILKKIRARKGPETVKMFSAIWKSFLAPEHDLRETARNLSVPALLVWGKRDPVIPLSVGRLAAKTIPGAELKAIDCGHEPFAEAPEAFLAATLPFIESLK